MGRRSGTDIGSDRSIEMAVQKSRVTPRRRGNRRAHDSLKAPAMSVDPTSGETHLRHHVSPDGYYRGKKVIDTPEADLD